MRQMAHFYLHIAMYGGMDFSASIWRSPQSRQLNFLFCEWRESIGTRCPFSSATLLAYV